jgi:uncharacterized membrane protein HdeD (DUF308 family)
MSVGTAVPGDPYDLRDLSRNWGLIAVRGVVALIFGIVALLWPGITLLALVLLFAAYAFVDGIFAIASGLRRRADNRGRDWLQVVGGIFGVLIGVVTVAYPGITTIVLLYFIGAWAIVTGAFEVAAAYRLRHELRNDWLLAIDGIVSIVFGALILFQPAVGALAVVWLIGLYAIISGILLLVLAFRLRSRARAEAAPTAPAATS